VQIRAATIQDARTFLSTTVEGGSFCATAEEVYATRTKEEKMVQELLNDWQKGAQGYISEVKEDNVILLGCENVNSLSIFQPTKSKMHKLTHLHQRHQTDGACIVGHGINFKMAATSTRLEDLFLGVCSSRVSASHNIHEPHNCSTRWDNYGGLLLAGKLCHLIWGRSSREQDLVGGPGFKLEQVKTGYK
jgi:hypothetical protein